jgi:hypothetical protein
MSRRMDPSLLILLTMVTIAEIVAFGRQPALPLEALRGSVRLLHGVWLDLLLGFLFAGLADVLVPQPTLSRWLGAERHPRRMSVVEFLRTTVVRRLSGASFGSVDWIRARRRLRRRCEWFLRRRPIARDLS